MNYSEILRFWFSDIKPAAWWEKDAEVDALITGRFAAIHEQASTGLLYRWRETADGALAEILVLDQFSRNMFRNEPAAFAQDTVALVLAQEALRRGLDKSVPAYQRNFFYLPFMHSEAAAIQQESVRLFTLLGDGEALNFAQQHKTIIDRFGRFPHRNVILGRCSTEAELAFLKEPGSSF